MRHREAGIAKRTADHQPLGRQLRRTRGTHQEGHIHTGLGQPTTKITTGTTGAEDQDTHRTLTAVGGFTLRLCRSFAAPAGRYVAVGGAPS